jgi:hypothetical protein
MNECCLLMITNDSEVQGMGVPTAPDIQYFFIKKKRKKLQVYIYIF